MHEFRKRSFTLPLLAQSLAGVAVSLPALARARRRPRILPALREQIMLGVTHVNDCRYCNWVHTGLALERGVDLGELEGLLDGATAQGIGAREAVAILYSQHYADTARHPSAEARRHLASHFNGRERAEINAYIQVIYFSNLTGNSMDAILARAQGRTVEGSLPGQLAAALIGAPVLAAIWWKAQGSTERGFAPL